MSSYSSTSLSSYDPPSSSSDYYPTTPSTSPSSSPPSPSPFPLNHRSLSWKTRSKDSLKATHPPLMERQTSQRNRALTLDVRPRIGVDPHALVGKQLTRVRRSRTHPCTTLQFSDGSAYQILVVGYDPHYPGLPKVLESDSPILNPLASNGTANVRLTVSHATSITLSDKAFQVRGSPQPSSPISPSPTSSPSKNAALAPREDRWTQRHAALALKFEEEPGWHCVWATMAEYDGKDGERCVFRNYADVYLDGLRSATAHAAPPKSAPAHVTINPQLPEPSPVHTPSRPTHTPASPSGQQKGGEKGEKNGQKPKRKGGKRKPGAKGRR
ncbi:hypothetical protein GSI_01853 [Ganoderma sinense ZZ0214-1]|uniref:Uncharacterized protein n=1 Tax=Ganoderma sinense ZZ0214-1 TaxID=1077348 RepID=A0A2G8SR52_9APHY|nr:hypothetical protein GSI_01853 [Ganoderma sinense ZZ0214-1]